MNRNDISYGQLDRVLKSLGFSRRLREKGPPAYLYEHKESGALITLPPLPETNVVRDYHLIGARHTLDQFGIADPLTFATELQNTG